MGKDISCCATAETDEALRAELAKYKPMNQGIMRSHDVKQICNESTANSPVQRYAFERNEDIQNLPKFSELKEGNEQLDLKTRQDEDSIPTSRNKEQVIAKKKHLRIGSVYDEIDMLLSSQRKETSVLEPIQGRGNEQKTSKRNVCSLPTKSNYEDAPYFGDGSPFQLAHGVK